MSAFSSYISTRGGVAPVDFAQAVMMGLADDGGLLIPSQIPSIEKDTLNSGRSLTYPELACEVMRPFVGASIPYDDFKQLVAKSYATFQADDVIPVNKVGKVFICELFHGPTL
ncbi:MAG: hypothetical protein J6T46_07125, partial [Victivallales bacterium]|nr:hypothetical protein [Victivallales bacterium]